MHFMRIWVERLPALLRERLEGRPNLLRAMVNVGWLSFDRILRLGVGLLITVWIARYLGPEEFGILNYAVAYVGLFLPVAMLGLDQVVLRDLVQHSDRSGETLGTAFGLKLFAGIASYAMAISVAIVSKPNEPLLHTMIALVGGVLISQSMDTVDFWFLSQVRAKNTVIARNASFLVVSCVRLGLLIGSASLIAFGAAAALEAVLTAIALLVAYRLTAGHFRTWRLTRQRAWELMRVSWPLVFSHIAITIYMKIDQVMLLELLQDEMEVGVYAAAVRISEVWYFIPTAIVSSVMPALIRSRQTDSALYEKRTQQLLSKLAILAYAVAIPVTLLAAPMVHLLFGSEYGAAAPTLAVHIWAGLFVCLGLAQNAWLINEGYTRFTLVSTVCGAVLNIGLNFALIPTYKSLGAAVATLVSYGITVAVLGAFYRPTQTMARMIFKAMLLRS
jgi:PST family polysaccharide transporter